MNQAGTTQVAASVTDRERHWSNRRMGWMALAVLLISIAPFALNLVGIDFGSQGYPFDMADSVPHTSNELIDGLSGEFTHTILEWSAFCAAILTAALAFMVYRIKGDMATPIIGVALFWSGCMDAFHTLAADGLIESLADHTNLMSFTWAISRAFNALIVIVGIGVILLRNCDRKATGSRFWCVGSIGLTFGVVAYGIIRYCATSPALPQTMYPDLLVTRPWDAIGVVLFLISGGLLYKLYRRVGGAFAAAMLVSTIPAVATQLHMTLGSTALFDNHFNIAHFLKILTYLVPFTGITIDVISTYQNEQHSVEQLSAEIAERRRIERDLHDSEVRNAAVIETAPDAIITIDDHGIIQAINSAGEEMFGYPAQQIIGQNVSILMPSPYAEHHDEYLKRYVGGGVPHVIGVGRDVTGRRKSGTTFPMYLKLGEFRIGGRSFFTGIVRDITEVKADEEQLTKHAANLERLAIDLRRRNRELDEFTHVASHDLQEPLRKLISFSFLLRKDVGEGLSETAETDLRYITDAAVRMQHLVQDLLALSHTGRAELELRTVDLGGCAEAAIDALSESIASRGASISSDDLPEVDGDPTLLTQLYQNLISNALKYCKTKPIIHLTVERGPNGSIFGVKDNGIGIKKEHQLQIFAAFKRLHNRDEYEGTGIGLATCRKVVERHGGMLWVESEPGHGSHFKFNLATKKAIAA